MNAEQLNSARLARWSQNGEARLTLESATEWLNSIGFCSYLPLKPTGAAPSASFLEAVVGRPAQTPSASERTRANELLARMVENSAAVPLKLGNSLGEQPDFVASTEVLRYIYALRGDRNFKADPSTVGNDKITPLALHCWQAIKDQGPLNVAALQPILGRDITEAAISHALQELWIGLYVFPILSTTGKPALWELLSRRYPEQVAAGASTGHAESQSAMVSLYLHAGVAATEEEVLAFLSPLAPQSKLWEVIRGLGSMRQLEIIDIGGRAHVCLQGGLLPEMVVQLSEEQLGASTPTPDAVEADTAGVFEGGIEIEREPQQAHEDTGGARKFVPRKFVPRSPEAGKPAGKRFVARPSSARPGSGARRFTDSRSDRPSTGRPRSFAASSDRTSSSQGRDFKKPGFHRQDSERAGFDARKPSTGGRSERTQGWEKPGEGIQKRTGASRPFERKSGFKSAGFRPAGSGPAKPWASKKPRFSNEGEKPWVKRASFGSGASAGPRERGSEERPRRWEKSGSDSEGRSAGSGARPVGKKPWEPRSGTGSTGRKPSGFKSSGFKSAGARPRTDKPAGSKPWVSRGAESRVGSAKSYAARTSRSSDGEAPRGPRKTYDGKPSSGKPWAKRSSAEGSAGDKPKRREKPESAARTKPGEKRTAKPFWAKNPRGGKGSVAASRTNRPRGGKKSGKKK